MKNSTLTGSVGPKGADNHRHDVIAVQAFLNNWISQGPMRGASDVLVMNGVSDKKTVLAIKVFQFMMGIVPPSGIVEKEGLTYRKLSGPLILSPPRDPKTFWDAVLGEHSPEVSDNGRDKHVDLFVVQPTEPGDPNYDALFKWWGNRWQKIQGVHDLANLIKTTCGKDKWLRVLRIGGHGNDLSFRVGKNLVSEGQLGPLSLWLKEIKPYFKKGKSIIYLDHCCVGRNERLLKKFSGVMGGIPVIAPHESQYTNEGPPAFEGDKVTICSDQVCMPVRLPNAPPNEVLATFAGYRAIIGVIEFK